MSVQVKLHVQDKLAKPVFQTGNVGGSINTHIAPPFTLVHK